MADPTIAISTPSRPVVLAPVRPWCPWEAEVLWQGNELCGKVCRIKLELSPEHHSPDLIVIVNGECVARVSGDEAHEVVRLGT